jgi:Ribbon-helix-helix domain
MDMLSLSPREPVQQRRPMLIPPQWAVRASTWSITDGYDPAFNSKGGTMKSQVIKRAVVIDGHKTSISLEDAFWSGLNSGRTSDSV